ncbi:hypothetical protein [Phyllobacterium lublinensis]|uniref:hypothetical protein n=1 Tax=Phyllobacterium lublinensis TaxID=2875708 RepID=UPI001CCA991E|nr:hypothetical protein [Phyllobacterium sp. 2063]MBZ9654010.1 hypothetical protein [Phyllobacterium sp. 2063]
MAKKAGAKEPKKRELLAGGGGNATASGVSFQASVAAYFASHGLAEAPLDARLGLGTAKPTAFRFETEAPVDDILISLNTGGWAFIQAKNSLTNSAALASELGKTCDEFARLWEAASAGSGTQGWDRPLAAGVDVMVIAVGPTTSGTIKHHLARALDIVRDGSLATLSQDQAKALDSFRKLLRNTFAARGGAVAGVDLNEMLKFVHILDFDFGGAHRTIAETFLANALTNRSSAPAALAVLEKECERRMAARNGISLAGLRTELARGGVPINAPPNYRLDIAVLNNRTSRVAGALQDFERMEVSGTDIRVTRASAAACITAAKEGSLVVVGDPGAGKSAVVNETARQLGAEGSDVVLLAVDRLQVESVEGLSAALGISHPFADVLANWPGSDPAYLILDALDACRFGRSEALFRNVIQEVLELDEGRWRIVASIRTFDLMMGQEFGRLFRGVPPSTEFTDLRFQAVRHIRVPEWSDTEFEELLTKIPALRVAIDCGGPKLAELARVPFNTRLLADLLTAGVVPEQLRNLGSQVQLLEMYWNERVRPLGPPAEQCLGNTVNAMIDRGRMEATRITSGAGTGNALDQLLQRGVLISVNSDREVAFRHHILFDYVASRTVVDVGDTPKTDELLKRSGASLLLSPALSFALQHLWETSGPGRDRFWQAIVDLAGDAAADPIARSVAARVGCDLPSEADDTAGFVRLMAQPSKSERAFSAFRHLVGALSVRLEDEAGVLPAPWCSIAEAAVPFVTEIAWPLRTLIHNLIDRVTDPDLRRQVGVAARAVMDYAFYARGGEMLMPPAIGFVAKTFGTDPVASRRLVERLLEPDRMKEHAANDMHWLANDVGDIAAHDIDLVVQIYDRVLAHTIEEDAPTNLGNSKILALTSNRRQDFKMSQWALKEAFPAFAEKQPLAAAEVAVKICRSHIRNEHEPTEPVETLTITVGDQVGHITPDYSYIWAAEHQAPHSDNAVQVVDAFVEMLKTASETKAIAIADRLIAENEHGWLWSRLLMVAKARGGALAAKFWPWAAQIELLRSVDTMKTAIDLLASQYSQRSSDERQEVEEKVLAATFSMSHKATDAALYFRRRVFGAIGRDSLKTQAAKDVVDDAIATGKVVTNDESHSFYDLGFREREEHGWLSAKGVDVAVEPNASILAAITACENVVTNEASDTDATSAAVRTLRDQLIGGGAAAHPLVVAHGWEKVAWTIERMTVDWAVVSRLTVSQRAEVEELLKFMNLTLADLSTTDENMLNGTRENTAGAIMNIVRGVPEAAARFVDEIRAFAADRSPEVRDVIATRIGYLWNADRGILWDLAEGFVDNETNPHVLVLLINFFIRASNDEPERIGALTKKVMMKDSIEKSEGRDLLHEGIGTLVFHLWTRHGQTAARETIDHWLADRVTFKAELRHGAFSIRKGLVIGYDNDKALDQQTRTRCQKVAFEVIDRSARGLEEYIALDRADQTDARNVEASDDAALLDQMSDQFFFAVGAPEVRKGEEPRALAETSYRKRYLADNEKTFLRIGDIATPKTIYYMLQLLDFLTPGDPAMVFDLTSHALLRGGKVHGYQFESLGADQFVKMIGRTIADHRELFDDPDRRIALVEVLEAFVDAGWPAARRLLYRLPEALR